MAKVFISYSSKQFREASQVCEYLERHGVLCWMAPRNIDPGSNYASQIVQAIRDSSALVLLASNHTNVSGHVSNEVSLAFDCKKTIIPFKIENVQFSDEYLYYLGRKHWIDAFIDFPTALESLLHTLNTIIPNKQLPANEIGTPPAQINLPTRPDVREANAIQPREHCDYSREEIISILKRNTREYSYSLTKRFDTGTDRCKFENAANSMFKKTVHITRHGKDYLGTECCVSCLADCIKSIAQNDSISVCGLPGSAKNMLLQLAFFNMTDAFVNGESDLLPCYIAVNCFEKEDYGEQDIKEQMRKQMQAELSDYLSYVQAHPEVSPVLFIDGVREHMISDTAPENILNEVLRKLGKYRRVVSIDTGLIKNTQRLKKIIPILSEPSGWLFETNSIDIMDHEASLSLIDDIFEMYGCNGLQSEDVYQTLVRLKYTEIDIFLVRMIIQELSSPLFYNSISAVAMYERMALQELDGDEQQLQSVAAAIFDYAFNEKLDIRKVVHQGRQWALVHKHHTYMEFLIAYHFSNCISSAQVDSSDHFFRTMLTSGEGAFFVQMLRESYTLQEDLYRFVIERYDTFDIYQKSNGIYWLGRLTYNNLTGMVLGFLRNRFEELCQVIKGAESFTQDNLDRQFLFRAICTGLLFQGQADAMDEYLCTIITNDAANALNRGATIEYYGDLYQMAANNTYYLDTDLAAGSHAIKALCRRVDSSLNKRDGKFSENNLVTLTTILQVRIQSSVTTKMPGLEEYVQKAVNYLELYQTRPQHTSSNKIEFYLNSVLDDFREFLSCDNFDISQCIYDKYRGIKDIKRQQWVCHDIFDPESVSEHLYSAWLMAMLFLPEETKEAGYNKREILDMLLIHDLAEAEIGDQVLSLDEPSKELKTQNAVLRKLFVKGTYPQIANLTYYYNIWTGYYNGTNINARVARDINTIQTSYTFFEYYLRYPDHFSPTEILAWTKNQDKLNTEIGFKLWEQLILNNVSYRPFWNR